MSSIIAVASLLLIVSTYSEGLPALELNSVPLGASKAELVTRLRGFKCDGASRRCWLTPWIEIDRRCGRVTTSRNFNCILDAEAAMRLLDATVIGYSATLTSDRVSSLRASVNSVDYTSLKAALTEKYEAPTLVEAVILENRFGARFQGETSTWQLADGVIRATQRKSENVDEGEISMSIE
jgi:hypothetical protein